MMMCIQNLILFCQFVLKILSKNQILTSIKGRNSVANLRKIKIYNTNLDLVTDNVYTNFGLILSIRSQEIEQKPNFDVNSLANLRKTTIYYTKVDLVNDNVYTKFGLNRSNSFQDIEQKLNSDVNQRAVTLFQICRNSNSSKLSCMSSLPARMMLIKSKMKELECSQDFSHYKSMGIFTDAQGQLTSQSLVRSGRISNSSEM